MEKTTEEIDREDIEEKISAVRKIILFIIIGILACLTAYSYGWFLEAGKKRPFG